MREKILTSNRTPKPTIRSSRSDFFIPKPGILTLADGTTFEGQMPNWQDNTYMGEVVFNTGMTGYIESLTDPSYTGEILVFTYPLIGNYGVLQQAYESTKIQAAGVIVSEATEHWSHVGSDQSFLQWLHEQQVPIITGIDTRALTKHLRTQGTMDGAIASRPLKPSSIITKQHFVSIDEPTTYNAGKSKRVILVDCGAKGNIIRSLLELDVEVVRVPHDYDYSREQFDGILLSNGPGDPTDYQATVAIATKALKQNKPVFGICLGNQILGLAAGARTYKLKFGHRGHNQPCLEDQTKRGVITSQNHGYAIDEASLPKNWQVSFRNLNDDSVEGIRHKTKPFFAVQFHPEACPGPTDTGWLFKEFYAAL